MGNNNAVKILDYKGLPCPMPIVKLSQDIKKIAIGDVVEVHTTDPGSVADFPAWVKTTGNTMVEMKQEPGLITIFIKREK